MDKKGTTRRRRRSPFDQRLESAVGEMLAQRFASDDNSSLPTEIYHYTDPKGLLGILLDGQLWATDIRYLNDSSELD